MPKPTQAEVADLVGRLRAVAQITDDDRALRHEAADAIEALAGEGAEPMDRSAQQGPGPISQSMLAGTARLDRPDTWDISPLCASHADNQSRPVTYGAIHPGTGNVYDCCPDQTEHFNVPLYTAPPAKPAGELPPLEPVAWKYEDDEGYWITEASPTEYQQAHCICIPLYAAPPARPDVMELPEMLPLPSLYVLPGEEYKWREWARAYALRALREMT